MRDLIVVASGLILFVDLEHIRHGSRHRARDFGWNRHPRPPTCTIPLGFTDCHATTG